HSDMATVNGAQLERDVVRNLKLKIHAHGVSAVFARVPAAIIALTAKRTIGVELEQAAFLSNVQRDLFARFVQLLLALCTQSLIDHHLHLVGLAAGNLNEPGHVIDFQRPLTRGQSERLANGLLVGDVLAGIEIIVIVYSDHRMNSNLSLGSYAQSQTYDCQ